MSAALPAQIYEWVCRHCGARTSCLSFCPRCGSADALKVLVRK